ncbi:transcriptional regulator [Companilactobacillus farciminis]|nr:transcriptional regulator [Companilactobacillus farciminis]
MRVVKKINNNVAVCLDSNGEELVAFGKGLGFGKMPYQLDDLNRISMTFYKLDFQYFQLLKEIPAEVFDVSAQIINEAKRILNKPLNPNVVFSLADHINFAIKRIKKYKDMQLPFSYDIEHLYPQETKVGAHALKIIKDRLNVSLPISEITAIAMHFVNSQYPEEIKKQDKKSISELINQSTKILEQEFDINVNRQEFTYNRFIMHLRYYIKRIKTDKQINENDNLEMFELMKSKEPDIYVGAKRIADYIDKELSTNSNKDELFYLMIYVKRIVNKEIKN